MRYQYSKTQYNKAVEFIANNNQSFLGRTEEIITILNKLITKLVNSESNCLWVSTIGLYISRSLERSEDEPELWMIEINVDPAISCDEDEYFDSSNLN